MENWNEIKQTIEKYEKDKNYIVKKGYIICGGEFSDMRPSFLLPLSSIFSTERIIYDKNEPVVRELIDVYNADEYNSRLKYNESIRKKRAEFLNRILKKSN